MSDTPRTDREVYTTRECDIGFPVVSANLCKILEREVAALREALRGMVAEFETDIAIGQRDPSHALLRARKALGVEGTQADEYRRPNPLGGPAKMFEVMALRIRAGETFEDVLADYGLRSVDSEPLSKSGHTVVTAEWTDEDKPLPEDLMIQSVHPAITAKPRHDLYAEALRMVGAKRSKGALVDLVHWLLYRLAEGEPATEVSDSGSVLMPRELLAGHADQLAHALSTVLPMVKGYAAEHRAGRNEEIADWAGAVLQDWIDAGYAPNPLSERVNGFACVHGTPKDQPCSRCGPHNHPGNKVSA